MKPLTKNGLKEMADSFEDIFYPEKKLNKIIEEKDKLIKELEEQNKDLWEVAKSLYKQNHGKICNWAGCFEKCEVCGFFYAVDGNWETEKCPMCKFEELKKKYNR